MRIHFGSCRCFFPFFINFLEASKCPKTDQDVPRELLERSLDLLAGSCEAFEHFRGILGVFWSYVGVWRTFSTLFSKCRKTMKNIVSIAKVMVRHVTSFMKNQIRKQVGTSLDAKTVKKILCRLPCPAGQSLPSKGESFQEGPRPLQESFWDILASFGTL